MRLELIWEVTDPDHDEEFAHWAELLHTEDELSINRVIVKLACNFWRFNIPAWLKISMEFFQISLDRKEHTNSQGKNEEGQAVE